MRAISSHDIKEKFLKQVCSFVKYKGAHQGIYEELSNHIEDHIDYLREMGLSQEEAEKQAVEAIGNEKEIGLSILRLRYLLGMRRENSTRKKL